MNRVRFIQGEDKHVKLFVKAPNDEPFTILSATYTLSRFGEVEAKGECDINGHYLDIKMEPKKENEVIHIRNNLCSSRFGEKGKDRSGGNLMLEITNVKLSRNTVNTGEKVCYFRGY